MKNFVHFLVALVAGLAFSVLNWNIDSIQAMEHLKGKSLIVHHPEDKLIGKKANLYHALFQRGLAPSAKIQELNLSRYLNQPNNVHAAALYQFASDDLNPEHEISRFLFASPYSFSERILNQFAVSSQEFRHKVFSTIAQRLQDGGFYWGSGEDAFYNRNGLSITDKSRIQIIISAKLQG
jgi:hypothetical protein